jgi:hypothetical protein
MKRKRRGTTGYEKATARKTGAPIRKLRKDQAAAESLEALAKARNKYKERGDAASCGDWLAVVLKEHCHSEDAFDIGKFERVLKDNNIEWDINRETNGWIGRFRMNGRQKLAAVARKTGYILISGEKVRAPGAKKRGRKAKAAEAAS